MRETGTAGSSGFRLCPTWLRPVPVSRFPSPVPGILFRSPFTGPGFAFPVEVMR